MKHAGKKRRVSFLGITRKGNYHRLRGIPNQDAYGFFLGGNCSVFAVADGVGTCKYAKEGARYAILVCKQLAKEIDKGRLEFQAQILKSRLLMLWNQVAPVEQRQKYATTVKACFIQGQAAVLISIGDGFLLAYNGTELYSAIHALHDFTNETECLQADVKESEVWSKTIFFERKVTLFLCTDGVAKALKSEAEAELMKFLHRKKDVALLKKKFLHMLYLMNKSSDDDKTLEVVNLCLCRNGKK